MLFKETRQIEKKFQEVNYVKRWFFIYKLLFVFWIFFKKNLFKNLMGQKNFQLEIWRVVKFPIQNLEKWFFSKTWRVVNFLIPNLIWNLVSMFLH